MSTSSDPVSSSATNAARPENPSGAVHPSVFLLLWGALGVGLGWLRPLHLPAWPGLALAGKLLALGGVLLVLWSLLELRRNRTTPEHKKASTALVTGGPYRISRHPIYLGLMAILFGIASRYDNAWLALLAVGFAAAVHYLTILREEAYLEREFGDAYRTYRASVRRWL